VNKVLLRISEPKREREREEEKTGRMNDEK
jgi:hypothetical protein